MAITIVVIVTNGMCSYRHMGDSYAAHPFTYLETLLLLLTNLSAVRHIHLSVIRFYIVHPVSFSIYRESFPRKNSEQILFSLHRITYTGN
jgi:hypothetical protein